MHKGIHYGEVFRREEKKKRLELTAKRAYLNTIAKGAGGARSVGD